MLKKFNELNSTTYLSASNKASKYGQDKRARRLSNYVFHEFIGKEMNDTLIKSVMYGGIDNKILYIQLEKGTPLIYIIADDRLEHSAVTGRKSAVTLSKIILKANPDSKYKNVNNIKIDEY